MKKHIFLALAMLAVIGLSAQEQQYSQKLDSVVGSYDFDWTRWKSVFSYQDSLMEEIFYVWQNQTWMFDTKTETYDNMVIKYRWEEEWVATNMTTYEYDNLGHLTLVMNYLGADTLDGWVENSKYEYIYNAEGLLDTCVFSTIRGTNWIASERKVYSYENQQCVSLLAERKGGWGPFANSWRTSYRYDFEYEAGELVAELYYVPAGWFGGGEMNLESKWEYECDANGNLLRKTNNVFNGVDWIVSDVYENQFDLSVEASKVLGLEPFWQSKVREGMGYTSGAEMPLKNLWKTCSITSTQLDAEFTLYCSGFEGVEEEQAMPLKAWSDHGRLMVVCEQPADITVYDLMGRKVAFERQSQQCEFNLNPGLYIVGLDKARVKVIVK